MARIAGVFYVITIVAGIVGALAAGGLAAYATVATIIGTVCYIAVTLILYQIFRPVSQWLSGVAAAFSLVGCGLSLMDVVHLHPLSVNFIVFFGFYCLLLGYLIVRSTFMPRFLGVLLVLAGANYLTFFSPALGHRLWPYNLIPGLVAEGALTLWLVLVGLNGPRWEEQSLAVSTS
jgi:Domain of unknown function (DUF4386)